jgi:type IV fimbrial biogenesis protein FimT
MPFVGIINPVSYPLVGKISPFIHKPRIFGFTLIELLTALTVLAILAAVAIPAMRGFILNGRVKSQTDDLAAALSLARSEAIKLNATLAAPVTTCISNDAVSDCSATKTDWAGGWLVWQDKNGDVDVDSDENILRSIATTHSDISITTFTGTPAVAITARSIKFKNDGATDKGDIFRFRICDNVRTGEVGREIAVNAVGRVSVVNFTCS